LGVVETSPLETVGRSPFEHDDLSYMLNMTKREGSEWITRGYMYTCPDVDCARNTARFCSGLADHSANAAADAIIRSTLQARQLSHSRPRQVKFNTLVGGIWEDKLCSRAACAPVDASIGHPPLACLGNVVPVRCCSWLPTSRPLMQARFAGKRGRDGGYLGLGK
jgi:hypothetical protein